jgi:hypothetical protein
MRLRFSRRLSLIPGLRLNLSKSGASISIGHRGAWYTIGPQGRRVTVGLPGSGLYWTEQVPPASAPHAGHRFAFVLAAVIVLAAVFAIFGGGR